MSHELSPITPASQRPEQANLFPKFRDGIAEGAASVPTTEQLQETSVENLPTGSPIHYIDERGPYVTVTEQVDSRDRTNYWGIDANGKKRIIGRDKMMQYYGHEGDMQGPRPATEANTVNKDKQVTTGKHGKTEASTSTQEYVGKHGKGENAAATQEYVGKHRKISAEEIAAQTTPIYDQLVAERAVANESTPIYDAVVAEQAAKSDEADEDVQEYEQKLREFQSGKRLSSDEVSKLWGDYLRLMSKRGGAEAAEAAERATHAKDDIEDMGSEDDIEDMGSEDDIEDMGSEGDETDVARKAQAAESDEQESDTHEPPKGWFKRRMANLVGFMAEKSNRKRNTAIGLGIVAVGALVGWRLGWYHGGGSGGGHAHSQLHEVVNGTANSRGQHGVVILQKGSNPWEISRQQLELQGIHNPTNAQIQAFDARLGQANGFDTWEQWAEHARHMAAGSEVKLP